MEACVPTPQGVQASSWNLDPKELVLLPNVPGGQPKHVDMPVALPKVARGHNEQDVTFPPIWSLYLPGAQDWQSPSFVEANRPERVHGGVMMHVSYSETPAMYV